MPVGWVFTSPSQEQSLSFSPRFENWNKTQLLIWPMLKFLRTKKRTEGALHSNASKCRNIWRIRQEWLVNAAPDLNINDPFSEKRGLVHLQKKSTR